MSGNHRMDVPVAAAGIGALAAFILLCAGCSPSYDLSTYEVLREPRVSQKEPLRVMTTELTGVPGEIAAKGLGDLFGALYKLESSDRMIEKEAPRGRWKLADSNPTHGQNPKMIAVLALPVRQGLAELPEGVRTKYPAIKLETWEYGTVAEILHVGGYDKEGSTIEELNQFIAGSGLAISGLHEEEYLKGPGMFFKGNPDNYYTIIRYNVEKKKTR